VPASRDKTGRFVKGQSGNPNGRKPLAPELKEALGPLGPKSIAELKKIIEKPDTKDGDKIKAIEIVLGYLIGKPQQSVEVDAKNIPQVIFVGGDAVAD